MKNRYSIKVNLIEILKNHDLQNVGPIIALNTVPVLYGYLIRWIFVPFLRAS